MIGAQTCITVILNGLPWKRTKFILSFLRLHPGIAFWTLLFTEGYYIQVMPICMKTFPILRSYCVSQRALLFPAVPILNKVYEPQIVTYSVQYSFFGPEKFYIFNQ